MTPLTTETRSSDETSRSRPSSVSFVHVYRTAPGFALAVRLSVAGRPSSSS